mmetsp:Transcript_11276/g.26366  ORF Transcript_11276/g.26366 Transcript_11276/m.26366 type:complete len:83 (+) Transcript_11276:292-540(+)
MFPAPFFGVGKPLFGRQLKKSSSSVKSLPKQREKLLSRMSPCSQSFVEFFHLVLGVGLVSAELIIPENLTYDQTRSTARRMR